LNALPTELGVNIVPKPPQPPPLRVEGFHLFRAEGKSVGFTVVQEQAVDGVQQDAGYKPPLLTRYSFDLIRPPQKCIWS